MSSQKLAVDSIIALADIPKFTLQLLSGTAKGAVRSSGIFTKEDITRIRIYVRNGNSLPFDINTVRNQIGYDIGIAGLTPEDVFELFKNIRSHAISWYNVETHLWDQSLDMNSTAKYLVATGEEILRIINAMPILERVKKIVGDVSDFQLSEIILEPDDEVQIVTLLSALNKIKRHISEQQEKNKKMKTVVYDFRVGMAGGQLSNGKNTVGVQAQVKSKYDLLKAHKLLDSIKALQDEIDEKYKQIAQLEKEYKKYTGLAFSGAALGFVGLAITGGIYGAKAEAARKAKNKLIKDIQQLQKQSSEKKLLQKSIETLSRSFSDIAIRMLDAEIGINNLNYMWETVLNNISDSELQMSRINDALKLTTFTVNFRKVIAPWNDVENLALLLTGAILDGIKESFETTDTPIAP
ncbi:alpha-xenorhabdolysin family binary toxin subunit A [Collimonas antrihumi]|uniref:alpha-xenorhabdolysin family binary toxin subunit A n=1 Tax=Collimonas antrihumi TaxID=1940615 RepID=UPI001B8CA3FF|nr:alpha-xenorhabdolysin family binary toxin subunit A [Collimonas antrihumi]